jgi:hypothetical protein
MKIIPHFLACLLVLVDLSHAQGANDLSGVSISPPGLVWFIQVFPDGSVRASYGSSPQHQIRMAPGSVDFSHLVERLKKEVIKESGDNGTQVAFMLRGATSHSSSYLANDDFLRELFPSNPDAWRRIIPKLTGDMKPDGLDISPVSDEMRELLHSHPIFPTKTPNNAVDSTATRVTAPAEQEPRQGQP